MSEALEHDAELALEHACDGGDLVLAGSECLERRVEAELGEVCTEAQKLADEPGFDEVRHRRVAVHGHAAYAPRASASGSWRRDSRSSFRYTLRRCASTVL